LDGSAVIRGEISSQKGNLLVTTGLSGTKIRDTVKEDLFDNINLMFLSLSTREDTGPNEGLNMSVEYRSSKSDCDFSPIAFSSDLEPGIYTGTWERFLLMHGEFQYPDLGPSELDPTDSPLVFITGAISLFIVAALVLVIVILTVVGALKCPIKSLRADCEGYETQESPFAPDSVYVESSLSEEVEFPLKKKVEECIDDQIEAKEEPKNPYDTADPLVLEGIELYYI
jgi:hypothetical protein